MTDPAPTLAELVDGIRTAMVTTHGPHGLQSRPVTLQRADADGTTWFLVGTDAEWLGSATGELNVTFTDDRTWVSVAGTGSTTTEAAVLEDLGDPISDAWFEDGNDPVALRVDADHVDWWQAPGKVGQLAGLVKGVITSGPPDLGERGTIA